MDSYNSNYTILQDMCQYYDDLVGAWKIITKTIIEVIKDINAGSEEMQ